MSFETVILISAITEFIVLSAIFLTLTNAFSHGALARMVLGPKQQEEESSGPPEQSHNNEQTYLRAA
ncbi:MAG: hypothetical protein ACKVG0_05975 [Alphaproteobacteria bacterium]|jgi:hypothetical protein